MVFSSTIGSYLSYVVFELIPLISQPTHERTLGSYHIGIPVFSSSNIVIGVHRIIENQELMIFGAIDRASYPVQLDVVEDIKVFLWDIDLARN